MKGKRSRNHVLVSAGDLEVDHGLLHSLVFGMQQPHRRRPVGGVQAFLLAGQVVMDVVALAAFAAIESESLSHVCFIQR